jgi:hypothetical protein
MKTAPETRKHTIPITKVTRSLISMPLAEAAAGIHQRAKSRPNSLVFGLVAMYNPRPMPVRVISSNKIPRGVRRKPIFLY